MTNLQVIKALYRAFRARDDAAFAALCAPDMEWVQCAGFPGGGRHVGAEAVVRGVFDANACAWDRFAFAADGMVEAGPSAVLVTGAYSGVHRATGRAFRAAAAHLYELRGGRLARYRQFADTQPMWDAMPAPRAVWP